MASFIRGIASPSVGFSFFYPFENARSLESN
jgi:hypothetical protein